MANIQQAKKRIRQTQAKNARNVALRSRIRGFVKTLETAIASKDKDAIGKAFKVAMSELHKGVTKGVIKKTTASRKVSRLSARIKNLSAK